MAAGLNTVEKLKSISIIMKVVASVVVASMLLMANFVNKAAVSLAFVAASSFSVSDVTVTGTNFFGQHVFVNNISAASSVFTDSLMAALVTSESQPRSSLQI